MYNAYIRHKCTLWFYLSTISKTVFSLSPSPSLSLPLSPLSIYMQISWNLKKSQKIRTTSDPKHFERGRLNLYSQRESPEVESWGWEQGLCQSRNTYKTLGVITKVYGKKQKPKKLGRDTTAIEVWRPAVQTKDVPCICVRTVWQSVWATLDPTWRQRSCWD